MKETIEKYYNWVKENLKMLVLVPAVLGGLIQLLSLAVISPSYIRFFSISQVVPDGLVALFIIVGIMFLHKYVIPISLRKEKEEWVVFTVLFTIVVILVTSINFLIYDRLNLEKILIYTVVIYSLLFFFILFLRSKFKQGKFPWIHNNIGGISKFSKYPFALFIATVVPIFAFIILPVSFNRTFLLPDNLENINNVLNRYNKDLKQDAKIRYFNDKYIFIELTQKDTSKRIEVLKFDAFFEKQNSPIETNQTEKDSLNKLIQLKNGKIDSLNTHISHLISINKWKHT